jgi:mannose-6-phosphate isomerase-like protein (cupin superfamily)
MQKLKTFKRADELLPVRFLETQKVKDGVECDIYEFLNDTSCDLGIIRVSKGHTTPLQKVLSGDSTVEGFLSGEGTLSVGSDTGTKKYKFRQGGSKKEVEVMVGQTMQWHADGNTELEFYEICKPPYKDGRFENLS